MSFDRLTIEREGLSQDLLTTGLDLDNIGGKSLLLDNTEAAKRLVRSRFPEITKEQADMMFDSEKKLMDREEEREKKRKEKEEQKALTKEQKQQKSAEEKEKKRQQREANRAKRKEERRKRIKKYKEIYKQKCEEIKKEAKNLKKLIKDTCNLIFDSFLTLAKKVITLIVKTASSLPGIFMCISTLPWNIPLAISHTMVVIEGYLDLLEQIKKIQPHFKYLDFLPLITSKSNLRVVARIIIPIVKGLRAFWIPIKFLYSLIGQFMKKISNFLNRNRFRIFRRATNQLKKLGHLWKIWFIHPQMKGQVSFLGVTIPNPFFPGFIKGDFYPSNGEREYPCYAFEEDDVDEIQGLLDTFICGFLSSKRRNRVVRYRRKSSTDAKRIARLAGKDFPDEFDFLEDLNLESLANDLDNISLPSFLNDLAPEGADDATGGAGGAGTGGVSTDDDNLADRFVYDLELPDGTVIKNITEEGVEYYKQNYVLRYVNAFTQSVQEAATLI